MAANRLIDTFGRLHDNLRVSVTDRCNIRCFFCMPGERVEFVPRAQVLSFEEITQFVQVAAGLGITKVRITGGEPLVRKNLHELIRRIAAISQIQDLALTTNAVLLAEQAGALFEAGLRRLNIHLDTLSPERFFRITRRDDFHRVMRGIEAARETGFGPIKINTVAVKGLVEPDIVPLARFGREHGIEIRYIEFMPLDAQGLWDRSKVLLADDILAMLESGIGPMEAIPDADPRAPASTYRFRDGIGTVGLIAPVSRPFCLNCNRLRLTADGKLRYCLFAIEETDVKQLLRSGAPEQEIAAVLREVVRQKWLGHEINSTQFVAPPRPMYSIGG